MPDNHKGKVLKHIVKKSGIKLIKLSQKLGVSRGKLGLFFSRKEVDGKFLMEVGKIVKYDFSVDFPDLIPFKLEQLEKESLEVFEASTQEDIIKVQRIYIELLEKQDHLFQLLLDIYDNTDPSLRKEIGDFFDEFFREDDEL